MSFHLVDQSQRRLQQEVGEGKKEDAVRGQLVLSFFLSLLLPLDRSFTTRLRPHFHSALLKKDEVCSSPPKAR